MPSRELRQHPVADDAALNFACTFEDRGQARVPPIAFYAPLGRVAVAAVELHGLIGHAHGHLGCEQFHLRGFALGTMALIQKMRDLLPEGACLRNLGRHVRQRKAKHLEPGDRMTELLALLQIGPRVLDGGARDADRPSSGVHTGNIEPALNGCEAARVDVRALVAVEAGQPVALWDANTSQFELPGEEAVVADLAGVQTRAVREGDEWILTGTKRWAGYALAADFIEVLARTRQPKAGEPRSAGLEPFLVVKEPGTFPEGMSGHTIDKIGYHGFLTWQLELRGVRVPEGDRLTGLYGDEGADVDSGGFAAVQRGLNIARVHTAARAVGVARAAVEDTWAYLQEREQFGHPIAGFQVLRFALADMAAEVAQARAFWQQVAHLLDQGHGAESESAQVKLLATEMAVRVTNQAMQLHGGNGYTTERRVERYWRDARLTTIFEGTSEIQRRIISDRMLPKLS